MFQRFVFSKRLRKWKRKQKLKRNRVDCNKSVIGNGIGGRLRSVEVEKQRSRNINLREMQSEVGEKRNLLLLLLVH